MLPRDLLQSLAPRLTEKQQKKIEPRPWQCRHECETRVPRSSQAAARTRRVSFGIPVMEGAARLPPRAGWRSPCAERGSMRLFGGQR